MKSSQSAHLIFSNEEKIIKIKIGRPEHSLTPTSTSDNIYFFP